MAERIVKMWFDPEADFLEVTFERSRAIPVPLKTTK